MLSRRRNLREMTDEQYWEDLVKQSKKHIRVIEDALETLQDVSDDVMDVMKENPELDEREYKAYGQYGFSQLLGKGNEMNGSLVKIMETLQDIVDEDDR